MMFAHKNRIVDGLFSFAPSKAPDLGALLTTAIDTALVDHRRAEYERGRGSGDGDVAVKRIGAGYIGEPCDRALGYRYHKAEKEEQETVYVTPGELQRHAEAGFWTEDKMAEWMRLAGIDVRTRKPDGSQFGYKVAQDSATGQYRIAGEIDGVIIAILPHLAGAIKLPCLWESKKATHKKATKFQRDGVAKADARYYGQLQTNMAYLDVGQTLFTMLDLDTMKPYWELIAFDQAHAQALTDRAVRVIESAVPEELPRIASDQSDFRCKFCPYARRCWKAAGSVVAVPQPTWLTS